MPTIAQARAVVTAITSQLTPSRAPLLSRICLVGSLARGVDFGGDIDLVLEIPKPAFQCYLGFCSRIYGGIDAIASNPASYLAGVTESEIKLERTWAALLTVGITIGELTIESPREDLDIICLPVGFDDPASDNRRYLLERIRGFGDWLTRNPIEVIQCLYP